MYDLTIGLETLARWKAILNFHESKVTIHHVELSMQSFTANEKPRHIVGIFKTTRICRQYVAKWLIWLIQHQKLANSIEEVLK